MLGILVLSLFIFVSCENGSKVIVGVEKAEEVKMDGEQVENSEPITGTVGELEVETDDEVYVENAPIIEEIETHPDTDENLTADSDEPENDEEVTIDEEDVETGSICDFITAPVEIGFQHDTVRLGRCVETIRWTDGNNEQDSSILIRDMSDNIVLDIAIPYMTNRLILGIWGDRFTPRINYKFSIGSKHYGCPTKWYTENGEERTFKEFTFESCPLAY